MHYAWMHSACHLSQQINLEALQELVCFEDARFTWHEYLCNVLLKWGFKQTQVDPYLFTRGGVLIVMHINDAVVILPNKDDQVIASGL